MTNLTYNSNEFVLITFLKIKYGGMGCQQAKQYVY